MSNKIFNLFNEVIVSIIDYEKFLDLGLQPLANSYLIKKFELKEKNSARDGLTTKLSSFNINTV